MHSAFTPRLSQIHPVASMSTLSAADLTMPGARFRFNFGDLIPPTTRIGKNSVRNFTQR